MTKKLAQLVTELRALEDQFDKAGFDHIANLVGEGLEKLEEAEECFRALETGQAVYS